MSNSAVEPKATNVTINKENESNILTKDKEQHIVIDHHTEEKKENEEHNDHHDDKKKNKSHHHRHDRRYNNKKGGAWKKLDVEVNFNKKKETTDSNPTNVKKNTSPSNTTKKNTMSSPKQQQTKRKNHQHTKKTNENPATTTTETTATNKSQQHNRRQNQNQQHKSKNHNNNNNRKKSHKTKKNRQYQDYSTQYFELPALTESQLEEAKVEVTKQIEYFFSDNELCRNTYLRSHMDVEGYLPAAIVFNFPSVVMYGVPYYDLMNHLKDHSDFLDVDVLNETVRVRVGWEKWLYPNEEGGMGCPRWIKQLEEEGLEDQGEEGAVDDIQQSIQATPDLVHSTDSETEDEQQKHDK